MTSTTLCRSLWNRSALVVKTAAQARYTLKTRKRQPKQLYTLELNNSSKSHTYPHLPFLCSPTTLPEVFRLLRF